MKLAALFLAVLALAACSDDSGAATADTGADVGADADAEPWTPDGVWVGEYSNSQGSDQMAFEIVSDGDILSGAVSMTGAPCLSSARFEGTIDGTSFDVHAIDDSDPRRRVDFTGEFDGESMSGHISFGSWGVCSGSEADFELTRE